MSDYLTGRGRRADPRRGLRLAALTAVIAGVVLLAIAAFLLSYGGIHSIARKAGVSPTLASFYPLIFDAMLVIACAAILALRGAGWLTRVYVWLSLLILLAAVAAGDALHAMKVTLPSQPSRAVVAVTPWVLLLLGFGLWLAMLRHVRRMAAANAQANDLAGPVGQVPAAAAFPPAPGRQARQGRAGRQGRQNRAARGAAPRTADSAGLDAGAVTAAGAAARAGGSGGTGAGPAVPAGEASMGDATGVRAGGRDAAAGQYPSGAGAGSGAARSVVWGSGTGTWTARPAPQPHRDSPVPGMGQPPAAPAGATEGQRPAEDPAQQGQHGGVHYSGYVDEAENGEGSSRPGYPEGTAARRGAADAGASADGGGLGETGGFGETGGIGDDDPAADHSAPPARAQANEQADDSSQRAAAPEPGETSHFQRLRSRPTPPEDWGSEQD